MKKQKYLSIIIAEIAIILVLFFVPSETYSRPVATAFCLASCPGGCGMVGGSCWSSGCMCGCSDGGYSWSENCPVPNS